MPLTRGSGFGSKRPKNMDLTDPDSDPQHWYLAICLVLVGAYCL
jgi:hypothetical protein